MTDVIHSTNYKVINDNSFLSDNIRQVDIFKKTKNPAYSFFAPTGGKDTYFHPHVYDLYEYGRIIDTESFVARAFNKKRSLMFKHGYELSSEDEKNAEYISKRINEISYVSNLPFDLFLRETAMNLITFHNAYVLKVRKKDSSSGKVIQTGTKEIEPIAAYFNLPPETIQVKVNDAGVPIRYRQYVSPGKYREYSPDDIIHICYNKRTGFVMGTPPLEPVKDDILALRRIEESIETLIYKSLFPIIHVRVGTEKAPARKFPDGTTEVDKATGYLRSIEDAGGLVTNERVEIKAIGAESIALRVEGYLAHFKARVFIGLGMSAIDFGEGDSTGRATGEVLSESLKESVMDYQTALGEYISFMLFKPLLVESGKYKAEYLIPDDEMVWFKFGNLDITGQMKIESHELNKMTQGAQSVHETRKKMGLRKKTDEELKLDKEVLSYTGQEKEAAKYAKTPEAGAPSAKKAGSPSKAKGSSNLTKNIAKPKNQYADSVECRIMDVVSSGSSMKNARIYGLILDELNDIMGDKNMLLVDNVLKDDLLVMASNNILDSFNRMNNEDFLDYITLCILSLLQDFA